MIPDNQIEVEEGLKKLRSLLLKDDREKLQNLETIIEDPITFEQKVVPIVIEQIDALKREFPNSYKKVVKEIVTDQLASSQEEIINAIYPVLGTMIRKYITMQFQGLKDNIDSQIKSKLSSKGLFTWIKGTILGQNVSAEILSEIDKAKIEEVFVVQRDSGLLIGAASILPTVNQDVVAGMLTAIKSFVEDAFMQGKEDLDLIEYETHKLIIHNFPSYFIVIAMNGSISVEERGKIADLIFEFAGNVLDNKVIKWTEEDYRFISKQIELHFFLDEKNQVN